ncbi:MAG: hypothetical protein WC959_02725 [Kiritimatiellales bacterium]
MAAKQVNLIFSVLAGFVACISAATNVSVSANANIPTENVVAQSVAGTAGYAWKAISSTDCRDIGQSFYVTNDLRIDSFSLCASSGIGAGASGAAFTVTIYKSDAVSSIGSAISVQTGTYFLSSDGVKAKDWITFDIDNITLSGGFYYTFVLSFDDYAVSRNHAFLHNTGTDMYPSGRLWQANNGGALGSSGVNDFAFSVQSENQKTVRLLIISQ